MPLRSRPAACVAAVLAGAAATAPGAVTAVSGDATLTLSGTPVLDAQSFAVFRTDAGAPDWAFRLLWAYRTPLSNTNRVFSALDTPAEGNAGPDIATVAYTNAGPNAVGGERFSAAFSFRVQDGGVPGAALAVQTLTFTAAATNPGTRTFQIFNMLDVDVLGVPSPNDASIDGSGVARFGASGTGAFATFLGVGASASEVNTGGALYAKVTSGSADLSGSPGPASGDVAGAYQWNLTLAPGASATIISLFAVNITVPAPSAAATLGGLLLLAGRRRR